MCFVSLFQLEVLIQSQMLPNSPALAPFWALFVCFSWFIKRKPIVLLWRGSSIVGERSLFKIMIKYQTPEFLLSLQCVSLPAAQSLSKSVLSISE